MLRIVVNLMVKEAILYITTCFNKSWPCQTRYLSRNETPCLKHGDGRNAHMESCRPRVRVGAALPIATGARCIHGIAVNTPCFSTGRFNLFRIHSGPLDRHFISR